VIWLIGAEHPRGIEAEDREVAAPQARDEPAEELDGIGHDSPAAAAVDGTAEAAHLDLYLPDTHAN
jgi:hypothetical protein